jgi:hypothetical protein
MIPSATHTGVLAIIPCSKEKIWDTEPERGAVPAGIAYTSTLHKLCQDYANAHADHWIILSAKYGFLSPSDPVPGPYDITFSRAQDPVVGDRLLTLQAQAISARELLLLLPPDYAQRVRRAFAGRSLALHHPFGGGQDLATFEQQLGKALSG